MQAHALTPRLVSALDAYNELDNPKSEHLPNGIVGRNLMRANVSPDFPFLSVLASGGHTLLIHSASLTNHRVLGSTNDIAIGECLDKIARVVLPAEVLQATKSTMYGALLEEFALPIPLQEKPASHDTPTLSSDPPVYSAEKYMNAFRHQYSWYEVPVNHEDALLKSATAWGWALSRPLTKSGGGTKINSLEMSFSGITTMVERIVRYGMDPITKKLNKVERVAADISLEERKDLARETMRAAFEHVASRVVLGLKSQQELMEAKSAVVLAGGVAANSFFRYM